MADAIFCFLLLSFHCRNKHLRLKGLAPTDTAIRYANPLQQQQMLISFGRLQLQWQSCFADCHTYCSLTCLRSDSFCVFHKPSFITSSVTLHFVSFTALNLLPKHGVIPAHNTRHKHTYFSSKPWFISLHLLHFVIHSFQDYSIHPLSILLCSPCGHMLRYGYLLAHSHAYVTMPHKYPSLC